MRPFIQHRQLNLYATPPHDCSYLPGNQATTIFLDPHIQKDPHLYSRLSAQGFRRSGDHLYRPHCQSCTSCESVRVPVWDFKFRRVQKRIWNKNADLDIRACAPVYRTEHFQLYRSYIAQRHRGGGMDDPTPDTYMQFLTSHWADTCFYEFRLNDKLLMVAVADLFDHGLSAVYTFFDPQYASRSLGSYALLFEIQEAKRLSLSWLYLGYWIDGCQKMQYKTNFQPLEHYIQGEWIRRSSMPLNI